MLHADFLLFPKSRPLKKRRSGGFAGLQRLLFNFSEVKDAVAGPVAIVVVGAEAARNDITGLFQFAAIVNINLAVINILPLPVTWL